MSMFHLSCFAGCCLNGHKECRLADMYDWTAQWNHAWGNEMRKHFIIMTLKNSRNVSRKFNIKCILILYILGIYLKIECKQSFGFYPRSDFLYLNIK